MLVDTHIHFNFETFEPDFLQVMERAREAGVTRFVNISTGLETAQESIKLAEMYDTIFATVGVHPCYVEGWTDEARKYFREQLKSNDRVVAVGEIGLDYYRGKESREDQRNAFYEQIEMAKEFYKPFVIHCRSAGDEVWEILSDVGYYNCVFHCFAQDYEYAKKLWDKGVLMSFNGTMTYPKNEELRKIAKEVPAELYLLETDGPFLPPQELRGKRCEPAYVRDFAEFIGDLRRCSWEQIAEETTGNAERFFKFPS